MEMLNVPTRRGTVLNGVLFPAQKTKNLLERGDSFESSKTLARPLDATSRCPAQKTKNLLERGDSFESSKTLARPLDATSRCPAQKTKNLLERGDSFESSKTLARQLDATSRCPAQKTKNLLERGDSFESSKTLARPLDATSRCPAQKTKNLLERGDSFESSKTLARQLDATSRCPAQKTKNLLERGDSFESSKTLARQLDATSRCPAQKADTVVIAITGIHGNFYSNPFYFNIGDRLSEHGIDFIYAQTNDAFGQIETVNAKTGAKEIIGSWNERFAYTDEDIDAYLDYAAKKYRHVILAGHSLGANKVIYYLSTHHDKKRVEHFILMSPANLAYMMSGVTADEKNFIRRVVSYGQGEKILPFAFMGWVECTANTADDWLSGVLDNTNDFTQLEQVTHTGALIIGTYDNFTEGDPSKFLRTINSHMPTAAQNKLIFIERTGHTYQQKHQQIADEILKLATDWSA